ncbi:MAG TPA: hypothetical protein VK901_13375 [Nitrospiraceae bacterium]|nr:hypothetical protein [Nitrospiraceae bacterium]
MKHLISRAITTPYLKDMLREVQAKALKHQQEAEEVHQHPKIVVWFVWCFG